MKFFLWQITPSLAQVRSSDEDIIFITRKWSKNSIYDEKLSFYMQAIISEIFTADRKR